MQRHGVGAMMLLGPTESVVITPARAPADPVRLAADLLVEAEHGTDTSVVYVTARARRTGRRDRCRGSASAGRPAGARARSRRAALGPNGGCVLVDDLTTAVDIISPVSPPSASRFAVADDRVDAPWSTPS